MNETNPYSAPLAPVERPKSASTDTPVWLYAGFWIRVLATLIDSLLFAVITVPILVWVSTGGLPAAWGVQVPLVVDILIAYVLPPIAVVLFWVYQSATPGKMMLGMRILDAQTGAAPSAGQCIGRYFAYIVSTLPLLLGFIWVAFDDRKQAWHDKLAGTVVVWRRGQGDAARFGEDS